MMTANVLFWRRIIWFDRHVQIALFPLLLTFLCWPSINSTYSSATKNFSTQFPFGSANRTESASSVLTVPGNRRCSAFSPGTSKRISGWCSVPDMPPSVTCPRKLEAFLQTAPFIRRRKPLSPNCLPCRRNWRKSITSLPRSNRRHRFFPPFYSNRANCSTNSTRPIFSRLAPRLKRYSQVSVSNLRISICPAVPFPVVGS